MNVRLQVLKTKSGIIFRRKVVTDDVLTCLGALGSQPLAASSILECSDKTTAAGLKMFRWNGGQCTGYTNGIPQNPAPCAGNGSVVLYSMDVEATSLVVVSNITFDFPGNTISLLEAAWDVTPNSCFVIYRVTFNNNDTFVSDQRATFSLGTPYPCAEYPLTVTPVDANHAVLGPAVTVKVVIPKALELSLNLTHGVTAVKASGRVEYTCNPNKQPTKGGPLKYYSMKLGKETVYSNDSTTEYIFKKTSQRCSDEASTLDAVFKKVTLEAFDDTDAQLGTVTATLTNTIMPGHRCLTEGSCIYYEKVENSTVGVGLTYDQLQELCQKTMFSDPVKSGNASYIIDLTSMQIGNAGITVVPLFMGLKRNSTINKWVWVTGEELPRTDTLWDSGEPSTAGDCVELNTNKKLAAVNCAATTMNAVCFDDLS